MLRGWAAVMAAFRSVNCRGCSYESISSCAASDSLSKRKPIRTVTLSVLLLASSMTTDASSAAPQDLLFYSPIGPLKILRRICDPTVIVLESSPARIRFSTGVPLQSDYTRLYTAGWYQQSGGTRRDITLTISEAMSAITNGNSVQMRVPNFSAAPGWDQLWESRPGIEATWLVSASGWTASGGLAAPVANAVVARSYVRTGVIMP